jgi:glycosyltransferase involved in cell wall biosynthesis
LEPTKGVFDLPEIARRLPEDVRIDVIGRGPEAHTERLRKALEEAGVAHRCLLHGYLAEEKLQKIMSEASVFFSCSYEEGWGISIAEALAAGLPCVTYDLPSHREIFGSAIVRAPLGDVDGFAERLMRVMDAPQSDAERSERRRAARRYSLDTCAQRQIDVFSALLGEGESSMSLQDKSA